MDRTERVRRRPDWEQTLLADTAARADAIAAVLAARLLVVGWDNELAAVVAALERIGADLARLEVETRSRSGWAA